MTKDLPANPEARQKILDILFAPENKEYLDMLKAELLMEDSDE